MSAARQRLVLVAACVALAAACTRTLDVLGPAPSAMRAGDGGPARDSATVPASCDACAEKQLCALDRCVDTAGVTALASSFQHSCAIEAGRLFCWGLNANGELGLGDQAAHAQKTRVGNFNDWLSVSTGEHHSCALRAPGRLYCWGENSAGQLVLGDTVARTSPTVAADTALFRTIVCGGDNCCALDRSGALYCWGDNLEGKLGQNDRAGAPDATRPVAVMSKTRWQTVAVGQGHVCAIRADGALYCWGRNTDLTLGIGAADLEQARAPLRVGSAGDWRAIAASQHHSCGIRAPGELYCWGRNMFFELATDAIDSSAEPLRVGGDSDWASVATGWFHSCGLKRDGRLFCWGRAIEGQLGQGGGTDPIATPTLVTTPVHWQRVALGNFTSSGVGDTGALYVWGKNDTSELGLGDTMRRFVPTLAQ